MPMRLQARERERERDQIDTTTCQFRYEIVPRPSEVRLRPTAQFNHHNAGRRNKRKQSLELARP